MCGIVGYVGKDKALSVLIDGLKTLEYRGYDSSGIAYIDKTEVKIEKEKGKVSELEKELNFNKKVDMGIAHTRWATNGVPNKVNAHPHNCEKITLVHNGIIENYEELKHDLEGSYKFKSETDTEVIAVLLNDIYKRINNMEAALIELKKKLVGSYAIAVICSDVKDKLYAMRKDSPLIVACNDNESFLASDVPAILKHTRNYYLLDEDEIAILSKDAIVFKNLELKNIIKEMLVFEGDKNTAEKAGYSHFMLKEIHEENKIIKSLANEYGTFDKLIKNLKGLKKYNKIDIIACGSAYHVGIIAKYLIEEKAHIPVNTEIASEYRYKNNFLDKNSLAIFISQSGETADTIASLRKVKEQGVTTLSIVNVVGSSIARESDIVLYTKAGPEIAVATTKAFVAQITIVIFLTLFLEYQKELITKEEINEVLKELKTLDVTDIIERDYTKVAERLKDKDDIFFLGRNIDYATALEGSLKLKEISYIHSEAYPSGELKHGTISLIEEGTPVISILTCDKIIEKTVNNIKETIARGSYTIAISTKEYDFIDDNIIIPKKHDLIMPLISVIPLQLIAFETAKLRGCDIDKPKNLAKSVTVE